ncbi:MAG: IMP cyclohydrolase [Deltaproteobacteria bacterium]|jgi:phosphoribosylaminoimidazolecarboxamide formyltransferase/IMP cyclohydrolase|nr:IMP cyclohydrolase [Deltaproteobacteria bacterium]
MAKPEKDLKSQYRRDLTENFPSSLTIKFGESVLIYEKTLFRLPNEKGDLIESGLRYGENPDQIAAMYRLINGNLLAFGASYLGPNDALISSLGVEGSTSKIFGSRKHPSKTNLTDVDSALGILRYIHQKPAAVIVKHNNPSGAAWSDSISSAFNKAFEADRVAAFGGALVVNRPLDATCAELINTKYMEVVAAPDFEDNAIEILSKKPDLRIFKIPNLNRLPDYQALNYLDFKSLMDGGLIIQKSSTNKILKASDFTIASAESFGKTIVSIRKPTENEAQDLLFGWAVEQGVTSNSVLFVKDGVTVGIGCGQQDRVGVVAIAAFKARRNLAESLAHSYYNTTYEELKKKAMENAPESSLEIDKLKQIDAHIEAQCGGLKGSSMVSDAFFPFRDAVDLAIEQKVTAIAHPGGSLRDYESIEAANASDPPVAMVFTGQRAFRH